MKPVLTLRERMSADRRRTAELREMNLNNSSVLTTGFGSRSCWYEECREIMMRISDAEGNQ